MQRSIVPAISLYALLVMGLVAFAGEYIALALVFAVYLWMGMLYAPRPLQFSVERTMSMERAAPFQEVQITLTIKNQDAHFNEVYIEDMLHTGLDVQENDHVRLLSIKPGQTVSWTYRVAGPRGYYPFHGVRVTARDHFRLVERSELYETSGQLFVLPPVTRLKQIAIRPRQTRVYAGIIPARVGGAGVTFYGVRDYQPGDPPNWINWRASARQPLAIFSNEYEQERVADVGIILDGRLAANTIHASRSMFEFSVLAAAALADSLISSGNRVGLLVYGHSMQWTIPGYGKIQREKILQALAKAKSGDSQVFSELSELPTKLFPRKSQLVVISPLLDRDDKPLLRLRANGYQVMVVSPDPVGYENRHLPDNQVNRLAARIVRMERTQLLARLKRAGVQVIDWDVQKPLEQAVQIGFRNLPVWAHMAGRA